MAETSPKASEKQKTREDELDRMLNAALAKYAAVEPRAGLEDRILAKLRADEEPSVGRAWWQWGLAGAVAVIVIVGVLAWRSSRISHCNRKPSAGRDSASVDSENESRGSWCRRSHRCETLSTATACPASGAGDNSGRRISQTRSVPVAAAFERGRDRLDRVRQELPERSSARRPGGRGIRIRDRERNGNERWRVRNRAFRSSSTRKVSKHAKNDCTICCRSFHRNGLWPLLGLGPG